MTEKGTGQMNELFGNDNTDIMRDYKKTDDIVSDMQEIINASKQQALQAVNIALVRRNWLIGCRIAEEELQGGERAEYGLSVIKQLSRELSKIYGKGFTKTNLYSFYSFYKAYPQIFQTLSGKSETLLSWSHYAALIRVHDEKARAWYEREAYEQTWSVRTLQRNINSQYYYRLLVSQHPELTEQEMKSAAASFQHGNEQLFASKYKLYLPAEQELRDEIEAQKAIFYLQQEEREQMQELRMEAESGKEA